METSYKKPNNRRNGDTKDRRSLTSNIIATAIGGLLIIIATTIGSFYIGVSNQLSLFQQEISFIQTDLKEIKLFIKLSTEKKFSKQDARDMKQHFEIRLKEKSEHLHRRLRLLEKKANE